MAEDSPVASGRRLRQSDLDEVLAACRLLVAVSVRSLAVVEDRVNLVQLRILTVLVSRDGIGLGELAQATGLHISRASRACDRLVEAGLISRDIDPDDRRGVRLAPTTTGSEVVAGVAAARRRAIRPVLERMGPAKRQALVEALTTLTRSAGEPADVDLWSAGWAT